MGSLRAFVRAHAALAALIVALALGLRALVPAGFMLATGPAGLILTLCPNAGPRVSPAVAPPAPGHRAAEAAHAAAGHAYPDTDGAQPAQPSDTRQACPYAVLALTSLAGADPLVLALAAAFVIGLGFAQRPSPALRASRFLRPPLRGPPAPA